MNLFKRCGRFVTALSILLPLCSCVSLKQALTTEPKATVDGTRGPSLSFDRGRIYKELGADSNISLPASTMNAQTNSQAMASQARLFDPKTLGSLSDLAKLYNQRDERSAQAGSTNRPDSQAEKLAYLQRFCADQISSTMAFSYQLQGKYKEAAEILANRIAALESSNADHSKDHRLAENYSQYAGYLTHLGRLAEAEQMQTKARALEPNHY